MRIARPRFVPKLADLPGPSRHPLIAHTESELLTPPPVVLDLPGNRAHHPVLVLPGLRGSDQGLARVLSRINRYGQGWEIRVVNPPGMGISPVNPKISYNLQNLAELTALCTADMHRKPILLGHSFGSVWASASWRAHPERYAALILLSPIPRAASRFNTPWHSLSTRGLSVYCAALHSGFVPRWFLDRYSRGACSNLWLSNFGWQGYQRVRRGSREKQVLLSDCKAVAVSQWEATTKDVRDYLPGNLGQIIPTAMIAGTNDCLAPREELQYLAQIIKPTMQIYLNGAGHLLHHENYPSAARAVLLALEKIESRLQGAEEGGL